MKPLPDIITKARARLLVRAPLLGSIALGLEWRCAPEIGTMATDGRELWFNPSWCHQHGIEKTMGVIAHEVLHVVNKHHLRRGERDPGLWNKAADLLINRLLEDDNYLLPPDGQFDRERRYAGLPAETIYARLLEPPKPTQSQAEQDRSSGSQPGNDTPDSQATSSQPVATHQETTTPRQSTAAQQNTGLEESAAIRQSAKPQENQPASHHELRQENQEHVAPARHWGEVRDLTRPNGQPLSPARRRQAEHDLDVRIRQAVAAARRAGKFSAGLQQLVDAATNNVDWRDRFRIAFDGILRGEASWARPNRRFVQHGLYLPGWRRTGPGRIAFVLDTSGSISERELALYTAAVLGILEETSPELVALIQCDAEVRDVAYLQSGERFARITVQGRGGTRFQPAFDWIADAGFAPNAIVYATDLDCSDQPQDPGLPVIWLTPTRGRTMPFGDIVRIKP